MCAASDCIALRAPWRELREGLMTSARRWIGSGVMQAKKSCRTRWRRNLKQKLLRFSSMRLQHADEKIDHERFMPSLFETFDQPLSAEPRPQPSPAWAHRLWQRCGRYQGIVLLLFVILLCLSIFLLACIMPLKHASPTEDTRISRNELRAMSKSGGRDESVSRTTALPPTRHQEAR